MRGDFATVLWVVCGAGVVIALATLITSSGAWEQFGKGGLVMDGDLTRATIAVSPAALAERDSEIRQMLEARNARRARRGEPPIDIEAELQRLTAPQIDDELRAEIRELAVARNARRARLGKPPLDLETEVERQIASLTTPAAPPPRAL